MRILALTLLLGAALQLAGCAKRMDFPVLAEPPRGEDRRILVTFVDRRQGREIPANPLDRYRPRGRYADSSWSPHLGQVLADHYGLRLLAEWPVTALGVTCVVYEVPPERTVDEVLKTLGQDRRIESVQPMHTFKGLGDRPTNPSPYNDPYYRLQRDLQAMRIAAAQRVATGRGIRVAIIDSGVDTAHPDLSNQIALAENLASGAGARETAEVHGTAVAGVIGAEAQNGLGIVGIAPAAELYALRACWSEQPGAVASACNSFTLALALNEAIRFKVHIINLSFTGPDDLLVGWLLRAALDRGILVVAADSGERSSTSGFPAAVERVIAVRSDTAPSGPKHRPETWLSAPGSNILTTLPHGTYDFMSGSSMAAPHISGLLALMLEVKPRLSREEAWQILYGMNTASAPAESDARPVIDACLVLARLSGHAVCPEANS